MTEIAKKPATRYSQPKAKLMLLTKPIVRED